MMNKTSSRIEPRRLLIEGPMQKDSSTEWRNRALEKIAPSTEIFDSTDSCAHSNRLLNAVGTRFYCTPANVRFNIQFWNRVKAFSPNIVWLDKGRWLWPWTLTKVRRTGARIVHHSTDDLFASGSNLWLHRWGLRESDLYLTTNRFNVSEIPLRYGLTCLRACMGYDEISHRPPRGEPVVSTDYKCDVVFVGHWESHTEDRLAILLEAGLDVKVWGPGWRRARRELFRNVKPLPIPDYVETLRTAKLAFCSLSRMNRNESTGRSFQIPAMGACLFAERTDEHSFLYEDGVEAIFFDDHNQMIEKARHYCRNVSQRNDIIEAGHRRCVGLGLSWQRHMAREWPMIVRWFQQGRFEPAEADDLPFWPGYRAGQPAQVARSRGHVSFEISHS
jgi:spore maturation protein CgeB